LIEAMNGRLESIDPIEHALERMPAGHLAENVSGVRNAGDLDHNDLSGLVSSAGSEEFREAVLLQFAGDRQW
jgi:hypothetical protein